MQGVRGERKVLKVGRWEGFSKGFAHSGPLRVRQVRAL